MKLFLSTILFTLLCPTVIFAETIHTGNTYINSSVSTNVNDGNANTNVSTTIESSGDSHVSIQNDVESQTNNGSSTNNTTYKKIEININGEKKVIESTEPGETKIVITHQANTPTPSPITPSPTITTFEKKYTSNSSWVKNFLDSLFTTLFKK